MADIKWAYLFLDIPRAAVETTWRFWADATESTLAPLRGEDGEFSTLIPAAGQPWVKLQAIHDTAPKIHLDLDVDDPAAAAEEATGLGASLVTIVHDTVHVIRSPGGFVFCLTKAGRESGGSDRAVAGTDSGPGRRDTAHIGQLCLDIPAGRFDDEVEFWSRLTGWPVRTGDGFSGLGVPAWLPFWILFQRLGTGDDRSVVTAHPDVIVADDRQDVVEQNMAIGATVEADRGGWTVMRDPSGLSYCLCDPPT